jgi:protein-L-isoaspartate(D-aspartate) O-methyltransferase
MTDTTDPYTPRMAALAEELRVEGSIRTDAVHAAFANVRRDLCVTHYLTANGTVIVDPHRTPDPEVLDAIYSAGTSLLTRAGDVPSSSSAPRIMARMLEALDLRPGQRVLEIGAGSGYNAALIHHITGAPVIAVEAYEPTAAEAYASIHRLNLDQEIKVVHRDGYLGYAHHGLFDRIIVTCSIAGIPPGWLDQLAPGGRILAPIRHGGVHPAITITPEGHCTAALGADFMLAAGPLYPARLAGRDATEPIPARPILWTTAATEPLDQQQYNDLWFWLAVADQRTGRAYMDTPDFDFAAGQLALVDDHGAAWIQKTGQVAATDQHLGQYLTNLTADWIDADHCPLIAWAGRLISAHNLSDPLLVPSGWRHDVHASK